MGLISWWYGKGWIAQWGRAIDRISGTLSFFSVGQLFSTLFSPYRQISASDLSDGTFGGAARAFADRLISRLIGSVIRTITIIFGLFVILLQSIYQLVVAVGWLFVPLIPVVGAILFAVGWVPSWT